MTSLKALLAPPPPPPSDSPPVPPRAGQNRCMFIEILTLLVRLNTEIVNQAIVSAGVFQLVFSNLVDFPDNNILHSQIDQFL